MNQSGRGMFQGQLGLILCAHPYALTGRASPLAVWDGSQDPIPGFPDRQLRPGMAAFSVEDCVMQHAAPSDPLVVQGIDSLHRG